MTDGAGSTHDARDTAAPAPAPAPAPPPAALTLAGHFELLAELGTGSSGTVHRARLRDDSGDLPRGSEVAVKFLRQDRLGDERARERLLVEGRLGQRVRHPNVAAIHGVETIELLGLEVTYLVMELVQGTTLRQLLQQQGLPVEDLVRRIGADAAAGLHALHQRGVVHRDVKPENLVLTPAGELKIVDLGLARPFGAAGGGGSGSASDSSGPGVGGTIAYAAPEALRGRPAGPRSDLYSLGIVLYEVATGQHPFARCRTADDMLHAQLHEVPARPSHLRPRMTPFLDQLVMELLAKEPDERPRDAAELARVLQQGEASDWWLEHEQRAPALASERRLQRMRRPADTPFFGRGDELRRLHDHLRAVRRGTGRALCIVGPEGIGRRRLLDEAMAAWLQQEDDLLYLGGEADRGLGHGEPFASALLDWLLRGEGADAPHAAARAAARARAELGLQDADADALIAVATGHSQEPPEVRGSRLAGALLRLPSPQRVLVLRVESADQLDTSGRIVLQRLLLELPRHRLLLLATAGVDGLPGVAVDRVELHGLDEDAFAAFGRALFRDGELREAGDALLAQAHRTLSGSPGNLIEALEHLQHEELLRGRPGDYHGLDERAELRPAPRHVARFERRVATLTAEQRRVLAAAAVLGMRTTLADLAPLAAQPELTVLETLSLFRGRIVRAQGGEVAFRHRDFQQALLRRLPEDERAALHAAAAALLAERGRPPLEVGLHRSQALDHAGAVEPLLQGLEELVRSGSRRTSLRIAARLRVHLEHLPPGPEVDRQRLRLLLLWARARRNAGQEVLAAGLWRDADALAHRLGDREGTAAALTGLADTALQAGHLLQAVSLLENVHRLLDPPDEPSTRQLAASAHGLHARILLYRGQSAEGLRHVQAALRLLPTGEVDLRSHLTIDLARIEALRHHYPTALKNLARVEGEKGAHHLPRVHMRLCLYRGQIRAQLGDDAAEDDLHRAAAAAEKLSLPAYGARAHVFLGERAFLRHRDDEARDAFHRAVELAAAGGDRLGGTLAGIHLFRLGGDADELGRAVEELALPSLTAAWLVARAVREREGGDEDAAAMCAASALELAAAADLPLGLHLRILALCGRDASARALLRDVAERIPVRRGRRRFLAWWGPQPRI